MLRAGAVSYLVKGTPLAEIVETIHRAARGQAVLSAEVTSEVVHALAGQLELEEGTKERRQGQVDEIRAALAPGVLRDRLPADRRARGRAPDRVRGAGPFRHVPVPPTDVWLAEASSVGLRIDVERAALALALERLPDIPAGQFLSVNLSPETLLTTSVLEALGADPARTIVEITEHAQIEDYEVLNQALLELRSAGLRLAIDDAGAGYSSLRHVIEISPDMIKLDPSLTRRIEIDRGQRALASALISFAREMNQVVVAEGIEVLSAVAALTALGARCGQGHYFGRPGPLSFSSAAADT